MSTTSIDSTQQRRAFVHWLRTGRRLNVSDAEIELKFNPWHDPDDGRFTHAGTGRYFGPGSAQSTANRTDRADRADRERKVADGSSRKPASPDPVKKVAEFAGGFGQGAYDVGKEAVRGLYEIATTNPATTVRNFGESVAKTIDAALAAEDTPARVQVSRAADTVANASARDLGDATGRVVGNVGLAVVPGAGAAKISAVSKLRAARPRETFAPPRVTWPKETIMQRGREMAKLYNDTAPGARTGYAPALKRTMPDGSTRDVKFDGIDGDYPIDRKWSVFRSQKAKDQALRQSAALAEQRLRGVWELPTEAKRAEAIKFLKKLNIRNIATRVVKP